MGWELMIFCAPGTRALRSEEGSRQTILLARRALTIKRWSLDARSEGQSGDSPGEVGRSLVIYEGLVRRPHLDQHACHSKREKSASLEGSIDG